MSRARTTLPAARPADTTELVETVRAGIKADSYYSAIDHADQKRVALAALDLLADALAAAARRTEQAEAHATQMEAERDAADMWMKEWEDKMLAAEARAEQAETERVEGIRDAIEGTRQANLRVEVALQAAQIIGDDRDEALEDMESTRYAREQMYEGEARSLARVRDLEALRDKIGEFAMAHSALDGHGVVLAALYRIGEECEQDAALVSGAAGGNSDE